MSQDHQIKTNERWFDQFNSFLIRKVESLIKQTGLKVCDRFIVNTETKETHTQTCSLELEEMRKRELLELRKYVEELNQLKTELMEENKSQKHTLKNIQAKVVDLLQRLQAQIMYGHQMDKTNTKLVEKMEQIESHHRKDEQKMQEIEEKLRLSQALLSSNIQQEMLRNRPETNFSSKARLKHAITTFHANDP